LAGDKWANAWTGLWPDRPGLDPVPVAAAKLGLYRLAAVVVGEGYG